MRRVLASLRRMARLHYATDAEGAKTVELTDRAITVGRDHGNTVCISDPGISKNHALLIRDGHDYKLFDLHSANGTWVNGERITAHKLKDGDAVRLAHLELRYEHAAAKPRTGFIAPVPERSIKSTTPAAPKKLASVDEQPVVAPKKLAVEPTGDAPRIRLKHE